jgi:hypothetical protein
MVNFEAKEKYLEELQSKIDECVQKIQSLPEKNGMDESLNQLLEDILKTEQVLRETNIIGTQFQVIKKQLESLLAQFKGEELTPKEKTFDVQPTTGMPTAEEMLVYVLVFNAQGQNFQTWQRVLAPDALIEHSINRPIYADKNEALQSIGTKSHQERHACLEILVKKQDILSPLSEKGLMPKDSQGFTLLKLKQGALKQANIRRFLFEGKSYLVRGNEIESTAE